MNATGLRGRVRAGGREAATLGAWSLRPLEGGGGWTLSATVTARTFWLGRSAHAIALDFGRVRWVWEGITPELEGDALRATLPGEPAVEKGGT